MILLHFIFQKVSSCGCPNNPFNMSVYSIPLPWGVCLIQKFLSSFSRHCSCTWPWTPWLFWPSLLLGCSLLPILVTCEHFVTLTWNALSANTQKACSLTSFEALCKRHLPEMHTFSLPCFYILQMYCFVMVSFFPLEHKLCFIHVLSPLNRTAVDIEKYSFGVNKYWTLKFADQMHNESNCKHNIYTEM